MNSKLVFLSNFLKNPKEVAAIAPSSKYVTEQIIKNIDFNKTKCIVEYGPGIGTITNNVLKNLKPDAKLICFEVNSKFCKFLSKNLEDPRLVIVNDGAEKIDFYMKKLKIMEIDYALSAIPFSLIKREDKKTIIKKTSEILREGGKFVVYQQYSPHLKKYLRPHFNKISMKLEFRNIPPTFIYACGK